MRLDQAAYIIIVLVPLVILTVDWYVDKKWTWRMCCTVAVPWACFTLTWCVFHRDWTAATFFVFFAIDFAVQPKAKQLWKK